VLTHAPWVTCDYHRSAMTLCMGILSALSTGFWGAVSDRMGRTLVMAVTLVGFATRSVPRDQHRVCPFTAHLTFCSDIILIITATYPHRVPFGYRFILLGPLIDGFCGGFSTIQATNNAYLSDTTPDGSRAKVFSRFGVRTQGLSCVLGSY
jgi:MFS family permease